MSKHEPEVTGLCCADEAVDIQGPVVEEAVLLQGPVRGMRGRLAQLLLDWPDHPLLLQLDAICERLLGTHSAHFLGAQCLRNAWKAPYTRRMRGGALIGSSIRPDAT
jgi:hypothetical protein